MQFHLRVFIAFCAASLAMASAPLRGQGDVVRPWTEAGARGASPLLATAAESVLPKGETPFTLALPAFGREAELLARMEYRPVMPPALRSRYPAIRTYLGHGPGGEVVALTESPEGLHAYVREAGRTWAVEPVGPGAARVGTGAQLAGLANAPVSCGAVEEAFGPGAAVGNGPQLGVAARAGAVERRTYVLALACTGEYGRRKGGTKAAVMATFNQALNILNAITVSEAALAFELHPDNDTLIFLDPATDPYIEADLGRALLGENPPVINNRISIREYDLGHVFTNACQDVGGVVGGRACNDIGKARGVTCHYSSSITAIVENVMAHEVAHQFAVSHSWNNCPGNDGQRAGQGAFEPGSGSTIMSYQGACGPNNNVSSLPGPAYYHVGSLQQFVDFVAGTASCGTPETIANQQPEIAWPYADGFAIPKETPFVLRADASDPDGDVVFFNWEQYNRGPATALCDQRGDSPLFRSVPPAPDGNVRYFPPLDDVLSGRFDCEYQLPQFARALNFRLTARDRVADGGGTVWEEVAFAVTDDGPFRVTSQSSLSAVYAAGSFVNVSWDVANTDLPPVSCEFVNVLLSRNNGRTFTDTLLAGTLNDGEEGVTLPAGLETDQARIKVEAVGNVFYAVSASRFTVVQPTEPGFTFAPSQTTQFLCLPDDAAAAGVDFFTSPLLGYDSMLTVRVANALPTGVTATLSATAIQPGDQVRLDLDFSGFVASDSVLVVVEAFGDGADTARREILFDVVSADFTDLALGFPGNGEENVSGGPSFRFTPSQRASEHVLQVSTDPLFSRGALEIADPDPTGQQLFDLLEPNTVYFWRVLPSNRCGIEYDVPINAFHTFAASCQSFGDTEVRLIPPSIRTTVEAVVPISESGPVSDLNIALVDVAYSDLNDLTVQVRSPAGQVARLASRRCGGTNRLIAGFDDEAVRDFTCSPPPDDGFVYKPLDDLAVFNGTEIQGDWKLEVEVLNPSSTGGEFRAFEVEFCANIVSQSPTFDSDVIEVPTGGFQFLSTDKVRMTDPDNGFGDLELIILEAPARGAILLDNDTLITGDRFDYGAIADARVRYLDFGDEPGSDAVTVVVTDNAGNLITSPRIEFDIRDDAVVDAQGAPQTRVEMRLAPNPASDFARVQWVAPSRGGSVRVLDARGRVAFEQAVAAGTRSLGLRTGDYPAGVYFVYYAGAEGQQAMRLIVER